MQYLCLVYLDEKKLGALSKAERAALLAESAAYEQALRRSGHYIASNTLQPVRSATTLRARDGAVSITDGPYADTTEQLGGFFLIEAQGLNDALHIAAKIPPARIGSVEVRPIARPETADRAVARAASSTNHVHG